MTECADFLLFVYVYIAVRYSTIMRGRVESPLTSLTPPHFYACPKPGPGFPVPYVMVFLCSMIGG